MRHFLDTPFLLALSVIFLSISLNGEEDEEEALTSEELSQALIDNNMVQIDEVNEDNVFADSLTEQGQIPFGETYREYEPNSVIRLGMVYNLEKEKAYTRQVIFSTVGDGTSLNPSASFQRINMLKYSYGVTKSEVDSFQRLEVAGDVRMKLAGGMLDGSLTGAFMSEQTDHKIRSVIEVDLQLQLCALP